MNDKIGVIGQMYVDRKSNKTGTLIDRDVENKKLTFTDVDGEQFQISFAAFKSNWRKVIYETPVTEEAPATEETPATEIAEEKEVEAVEPADDFKPDVNTEVEAEPETAPAETIIPQDEDSKIKDFVKALTDARVASVDIIGDNTTIMADDVTICTLDKVEGGYKMFMLPDIFIFASWGNSYSVRDIHFNIKQGKHYGVVIDCVKASLGDILQIIKTAAVEINLYGYID